MKAGIGNVRDLDSAAGHDSARAGRRSRLPQARRSSGRVAQQHRPFYRRDRLERSIAAANELRWQPLPTLQLYNAYTRKLDQATADFIQHRGAGS